MWCHTVASIWYVAGSPPRTLGVNVGSVLRLWVPRFEKSRAARMTTRPAAVVEWSKIMDPMDEVLR